MNAPASHRASVEFRCPECNSFEFGSVLNADRKTHTRYCHGHVYDPKGDCWRGCPFSWQQVDDWRHFVARFADRQSYERATSFDMIAGCVVAAPAGGKISGDPPKPRGES